MGGSWDEGRGKEASCFGLKMFLVRCLFLLLW
jgi:hypothetical protein